MPKDFKPGCARPTGGPAQDAGAPTEKVQAQMEPKATEVPMIKVGKKAPDFTAPAYLNGKFVSVDLSEYKGQWVLLCFYPGDFTFV